VTYYKIKEGDNLGSIALKFHVSVKQLKSWNGLKSDFLRAGKTLKILK
jgi:membrane-bound lytic murein transglycosylase D